MLDLLNKYFFLCLRLTGFVRRLQWLVWEDLENSALPKMGYAVEWREKAILPHYQVVSIIGGAQRDEIFLFGSGHVYSALRDARGFFLVWSVLVVTMFMLFWVALPAHLVFAGSFPLELFEVFISLGFAIMFFAGTWGLSFLFRLRLTFFLWRARKAKSG